VPGTPLWGTWYFPVARSLAQSHGGPEAPEIEGHFAALSAEMGRFGSDPAKVADQTRALSADLARWLEAVCREVKGYDASKLKSLIETVQAPALRQTAPGWDGAAQHYLALQPLRLSLKGLDPSWTDAPLEADLQKTFQALQFPR